MKRLLTTLLFLPALLLCMALAQDALPTIPGVSVPDSVWYIAATVIGIVVKAVASPLTQLLKTRVKNVLLLASTADVKELGQKLLARLG